MSKKTPLLLKTQPMRKRKLRLEEKLQEKHFKGRCKKKNIFQMQLIDLKIRKVSKLNMKNNLNRSTLSLINIFSSLVYLVPINTVVV